jgi:hypothetical protein
MRERSEPQSRTAYGPPLACRPTLTARAQFKRGTSRRTMKLRQAAEGVVNRTMLFAYQKLVLDQVAHYEQLVAQQKLLIEGLSPNDQAIVGANEYLSTLEMALALNVAHRDLLQQELAAADPE